MVLNVLLYIAKNLIYMEKGRCLWLADDGRCANCKAKRIRHDVLRIENYDYCSPEKDYETCEFFKERPIPKRG
ncbi:MAG: hypothetical protein PWQ62_676 [Candidatus Methanomethylophilaceae archaeon]|nr:hypothetical protein [Candidatus Methanomethylophilaceae archaeon]